MNPARGPSRPAGSLPPSPGWLALNLSQTSAQRHRTYFLLNNKAVRLTYKERKGKMRARLLTILAVYTRIHAQTVPRERKKTELGAVVRVCTALDFIFTHTQNKQTKEITNTLSTGTGVCASQIAPVAIRPLHGRRNDGCFLVKLGCRLTPISRKTSRCSADSRKAA